ncbi:hypothetical protein BpHYR1_015073 [Brachionus plicatilis]|uniref:Uncharacterized protein n=1 Tax=Brachionus plicatilis TaxID=10195 RepID=A0A3M7SN04_BRAPC|nr:hypothetical protein BpHYR1_015073 [Brachionus plicatilis]
MKQKINSCVNVQNLVIDLAKNFYYLVKLCEEIKIFGCRLFYSKKSYVSLMYFMYFCNNKTALKKKLLMSFLLEDDKIITRLNLNMACASRN